MAYMFKYDSVHRMWPGEVTHSDDYLVIDGQKIKGYSKR
jgi:glyceraldehyde 3-phosphate dehydrogenase